MNTLIYRLIYRTGAAVAGVAVAFGVGGAAHAQNESRSPAVSRPFAVKLGLRFPNDAAIKNTFGDTWFSGGISYDFAQSKTMNPVVYQLYADYTQRRTGGAAYTTSSGFASGVGDITGRLFGIGPAAKFLLAPLTARAQPYIGVGAGYYRATVPVQYVYSSAVSPFIGYGGVGTRSMGAPGGKIFAGYQIKEGFMVEADFTYVREIDHLKTGGLGARIGYQF